MASLFVAALLRVGAAVLQSPLPVVPSQAITPLTTAQIDAFDPFTYFAGAAYCNSSATLSWSCGVACNGNKNFKPVATGGDGSAVQYWYVGYDPDLNTVIVGHQGTHPAAILPLLTDGEFVMLPLDPSLFPGLPVDIWVHSAFGNQQALTSSDILSAVNTTMSQYGTTSVTMVGHSLGAAIALLDSAYLPLHLPSGTTFQTILYGLPRVGNQAFADYVDANLHVTHVNNLKDPIPIVPPMTLGFVHPSGEVHIRETGEWAACPGQDNPSTECIVGDVPDLLDSNEQDHDGPYNGIVIAC